MHQTRNGRFRFHRWSNCKHVATSLALIVAAGLILAGLVWLSDAYEVSRFTLRGALP